MIKIKKKMYAICSLLIVCVLLLGVVFSSFVNATYYDENAYNGEKLYLARLLFDAASKCIRENAWRAPMNIDFSSHNGGDDDNTNPDSDGFGLAGKKTLFYSSAIFKTGGDGVSYSSMLESLTPKGYDDGKVRCDDTSFGGEFNHIPRLMELLDIYDSDHLDELICHGDDPGMLKITSGRTYGSSIINPGNSDYDFKAYTSQQIGAEEISPWPSALGDGNSCAKNLAFFKAYKGTDQRVDKVWFDTNDNGVGNYGSSFYMRFEKAPGAENYFKDYMNEYLGNQIVDEGISPAEKYWRSYGTFNDEERCAEINNGVLSVDADATNMIGIYNAKENKIRYLNRSNIHENKAFLFVGGDDTTWSCKKFAEDLGANVASGGINEEKVKALVLATGERDKKSCEDDFKKEVKDKRNYYNSYKRVVEAADKLRRVTRAAYNGINDFLADGDADLLDEDSYNLLPLMMLEPENPGHGEVPTLADTGERVSVQDAIESWMRTIKNANNPDVFSDDIGTLAEEMISVLNATEVESTGYRKIKTVGESVTSEVLGEIRRLLNNVDSEYTSANGIEDQLDDIISKYEKYIGENGKFNNDPWEAKVDITNGNNTAGIVCVALDDFNSELEELDLPDLSINGWTSGGWENPNNDDASSDPCHDIAGGFGYWECEVVDQMVATVDGTDTLLDTWLSVDSNLVDRDSDAYRVWELFRVFGNIAIVIVLLVIIFSQLTGIGIDNYGIKKMLPKLIIVAVLINLSHVLCELAIDVSNLLGNGAARMFESMGKTIGTRADVGQWMGKAVGAIFGLAAGGGAVAGSVLSIIMEQGNGKMIALMIILVLLPVLVAILLFFVAIGARMVIVVLFTAISPLAVVLYVLPNTQGLFKKYINIFKTALVVYPICGALYGLGFVIRSIMYGDGHATFGGILVAMIAPYLSFFALPMLTKSAISALGAVGAAITSAGSGLRSGVGKGVGAVQQTEAFKNAVEDSREKRGDKRAANIQARLKRKQESGKKLSDAEIRKLRKANEFRASYQARLEDDKRRSTREYAEAAEINAKKKAEADDVAVWETLLNDKTRNGEDKAALLTEFNDAVDKGLNAKAVAVARIAGRRKDTAKDFLDKGFIKMSGGVKDFNDDKLGAFRAAAKEIGTNTNYMEADPFGFSYAQKINVGERDEDGKNHAVAMTYEEWENNAENVRGAVNNFVTDSRQMAAMKSSALKTLGDANLEDKERTRIRTLANNTIKRYQDGLVDLDTTKIEAICDLSSDYEWDRENGKIVPKKGGGDGGTLSGGATGGSSGGNGGVAAEGEKFSVPKGTAGNVSDEALLEVATAPGVASNVADAAEQEYLRRYPNFNNDSDARRSNSRGTTGNRGGYVPE